MSPLFRRGATKPEDGRPVRRTSIAGAELERVSEPNSVIGLDFGTTNSCVSFVNARGEIGRVRVSSGNEPYDTVLASRVLDPLGTDPRVGLDASAALAERPSDKYLEYFKPL